MAEDQAQKTEPATPRRREDARKKGQVAQSRELQSVVVLATALVALLSPLGDGLLEALLKTVQATLGGASAPPRSLADFHAALLTALAAAALALAPILFLLAATSGLSQLVQTGPLWSLEALAPKFERVDPVQGLKRLFSLDRVVELVKSVFKVAAVGTVAWLVVSVDVAALVSLSGADQASALALTTRTVVNMAGAVLAMLTAMAIVDLVYQRWRYEQKIRMTKREVRDELKQREGDPLLRGRFRQLHRELSRSRMIAAVSEADVVVTNPTHYAVALRYDRRAMAAPEVMAKGRGHVALRIREAARQHDVPVVENAPLARVLHRTCEVGAEVPENLFQAVAEVLAFVYRLGRPQARSWGTAS